MTRKLAHIRPSMCSTLMVPLLEIICKTLTEVIVCYFIILKVCSYVHSPENAGRYAINVQFVNCSASSLK